MRGIIHVFTGALLFVVGNLPDAAAQQAGPSTERIMIFTDKAGDTLLEKKIVRTVIVTDSSQTDRPGAEGATRTITITIDGKDGMDEQIRVVAEGEGAENAEGLWGIPLPEEDGRTRVLRLEADELIFRPDPASPDRRSAPLHWMERIPADEDPRWSEEEELIEEMDGQGVVRKRITRKRNPAEEEELTEEMDGDGVVIKRTVRKRKSAKE
jgi:hypothetical protein